jgi:hypothetical protein
MAVVPKAPRSRDDCCKSKRRGDRTSGAGVHAARRETSKDEYAYRHTCATKAELIAAGDNWMRFYNNERRHSALRRLSSIGYEKTLEAVTERKFSVSTLSGEPQWSSDTGARHAPLRQCWKGANDRI